MTAVSPSPAHPSAPSAGRPAALGLTPVSLPGGPSSLLMVSAPVGLVAADRQLYRSRDGGHTWQAEFAHCAQAQMVGMPCGDRLTSLALLPGGVVLAGAAGLDVVWRSRDLGRSWDQGPDSGGVG